MTARNESTRMQAALRRRLAGHAIRKRGRYIIWYMRLLHMQCEEGEGTAVSGCIHHVNIAHSSVH